MSRKIFLGITGATFVGGLFLLLFFNKNILYKKNIGWLTPPPTRPIATVNTEKGTSNSKKISFPTFHINLRVPSNLKTNKEVDSGSEDTLIGSNFIAFYTPDTVIDSKKHIQTAGAKISINVVGTKKDFTDEHEIIPTTNLEQAATDNSVIPTNNALLTNKTMQVYSFPIDISASASAWVYNAEGLVKISNKMLDITFYCVDYSSGKDSPTCQKLLKEILPTLQR